MYIGKLLLLLMVICNVALINCNYVNTWAVHIKGGEDAAKLVSQQHNFVYINKIVDDYYHFAHPKVIKRSTDKNINQHNLLSNDDRVLWLQQQKIKHRSKRDLTFNDPEWPKQWYLNRGNGLDMNVMEALNDGYTGKGVVVTILDDGIERDHPDLKKNYDADASYDANGNDADPQPRYDPSNENRHGTRCAGEVAAEANNGICGIGIAYGASIGGVRMLDGPVTDAIEGQSLALNPQHIDIYSASWGPDDDGRTVDGPGPMARRALYAGISNGRRGLGSIFVWASGNGGRDNDNCNCDGYTSSIYTLSISSTSENGLVPWFSEGCSSTLATTYSSGMHGEKQIVTTDLRYLCTSAHTGTSASAPLAAGIVALALEANPMLTWRDMQHIVVETSKRANLKAEDWVQNGAKKWVSHHYGFGLMDASAIVRKSENWETVPPQQKCIIQAQFDNKSIGINSQIEVLLNVSEDCVIRYIEHVESIISLSTTKRGDIEIYLISPLGCRSQLLTLRLRDVSADGFNGWPFMSTHHWGENPVGIWKLEIKNEASVALLKNWTLVVYGTNKYPISSGTRRLLDAESCQSNEYLLDMYCYTRCPRLYFPGKKNVTIKGAPTNISICDHCHGTCKRCRGPSETECIGCPYGRHLNLNGECLAEASWFYPPHRRTFMIIILVCFLLIILLTGISITICILRRNTMHKTREEEKRPFLDGDDKGGEE